MGLYINLAGKVLLAQAFVAKTITNGVWVVVQRRGFRPYADSAASVLFVHGNSSHREIRRRLSLPSHFYSLKRLFTPSPSAFHAAQNNTNQSWIFFKPAQHNMPTRQLRGFRYCDRAKLFRIQQSCSSHTVPVVCSVTRPCRGCHTSLKWSSDNARSRDGPGNGARVAC